MSPSNRWVFLFNIRIQCTSSQHLVRIRVFLLKEDTSHPSWPIMFPPSLAVVAAAAAKEGSLRTRRTCRPPLTRMEDQACLFFI